jgi:hypothetical protein
MVSDNGIGSEALGQFDPSFVPGGADTGGAVDNSYAGNTWSSNEINVADFSGIGGSPGTPEANSYGPFGAYTMDNSCDPGVGQSTELNTESGNSNQYGC